MNDKTKLCEKIKPKPIPALLSLTPKKETRPSLDNDTILNTGILKSFSCFPTNQLNETETDFKRSSSFSYPTNFKEYCYRLPTLKNSPQAPISAKTVYFSDFNFNFNRYIFEFPPQIFI